jgi:hypothetical protein
MFTQKLKPKAVSPKTNTTSGNAFVNAATSKTTKQLKKRAKTTSLGNNAVKYTTTNNVFVDQFGMLSNYKAPRDFQTIFSDANKLLTLDVLKAVCLAVYIRLITRATKLHTGETLPTQRGQGLKHEGIVRLMHLAITAPLTFWKNVDLFIAAGSWKDIIQMLQYDLVYNGWDNRQLDWNKFGNLIKAGLVNEEHNNLLKKYLPSIRTNSKCITIEAQADNQIAKWICSLLFGSKQDGTTYKQYRKLKTSGTAHEWQKLISKKLMDKIDFNTIHGRALAKLVGGKFIKNQGLETKYDLWISSQPVAKYTGYPYELVGKFKNGPHDDSVNTLKDYQKKTINAQFLQLVETAKKGMNQNSGFLVVVDSSSSMTSLTRGTNVSAYAVACSMALYFSYLLKGAFEGIFAEFSDDTIIHTWKGKTPIEKLMSFTGSIVAGTNFQSIADYLVKMKKKGVPESDFPTGILCISDGCFNNTGTNKTNTKTFLKKLENGGFSKEYVDNFKIVLWDVPNTHYGKSQTAFEGFADVPNLFYMSGLDPSGIAFLTGTTSQQGNALPKTAEELFAAAIGQEIMQRIVV